MIRETELFFGAVMRGDSSILDFIDADFTYLNERLARHYGISGVKGEQFRRVKLKGRQRGRAGHAGEHLDGDVKPDADLAGQAGKVGARAIAGNAATAAAAQCPDADRKMQKALTAATVRLRMEQHRSKASCAVCHNKLDPLGFGLENFDAVGAWRDQDGGVAG